MFDRIDLRPPGSLDKIDRTEEVLAGAADDAPGDETRGGADRADERTSDAPEEEMVSTTLPVPADEAYEVFCDVESSPRWVSVVSSVQVLERDAAGRTCRAAFLAQLEQATIGYTVTYAYDAARRRVTWDTVEGSPTVFAGRAEFVPLGDRACLIQYQLELVLPQDALPRWEDPFFSGHAASVVMNDFRDYISRNRRH
jgi:uncharacterized membrane protein